MPKRWHIGPHKTPHVYVKSLDGQSWYVGPDPMALNREPSYQLGGFWYAADWPGLADDNKRRAIAFARSVADHYTVHNAETGS